MPGRISDLIRRRGDIEADAILRQGDIRARRWDATGDTIARTFSDLVRFREDEPRRRYLTAQAGLMEGELADRQRQQLFQQRVREYATLPQDEALSKLEQEFPLEGRQMREAQQKLYAQNVRALHTRVDEQKTALGRGAQLLRELDTMPEAYADVRPKLLEITSSVNPELAQHFPQQLTAENRDNVRGLMQMMTDGAQQLEIQTRALKDIEDAISRPTKRAEDLNTLTRSIAQLYYSEADTADEWNAAMEYARDEIGAPASVLKRFGNWDDAAPERAAQLAMTSAQRTEAGKAPSAGSKEDIYASYAREFLKGRRWHTMSATEKTRAEKWWKEQTGGESEGARAGSKEDRWQSYSNEFLGGRPWPSMTASERKKADTWWDEQPSGSGGPSQAQRATAERWKMNQLAAAEDDFSAATQEFVDRKEQIPQHLIDRHSERKRRIQASYEAQLGARPRTGDVSPPPPPPPPSATAASTPAAPKGSQPVAAAADVERLLQNEEPGQYTLTDGSVWRKTQDGRVERVR
jgi:hypothetical protein